MCFIVRYQTAATTFKKITQIIIKLIQLQNDQRTQVSNIQRNKNDNQMRKIKPVSSVTKVKIKVA